MLWTVARVALGLSDDEFWNMSPREFFALTDRYQEREQLLNYRAGLAAAAIYNVNRSSQEQSMIEPMDFFQRKHEPTAEEIATGLDNALRCCDAASI